MKSDVWFEENKVLQDHPNGEKQVKGSKNIQNILAIPFRNQWEENKIDATTAAVFTVVTTQVSKAVITEIFTE